MSGLLDQFQERIVRAIKDIHNPGNSILRSNFQRDVLCRIISQLVKVKFELRKQLDVGIHYSKHSKRNCKLVDANALISGQNAASANPYRHFDGREAGKEDVDWQREGFMRLRDGRVFNSFLRNSVHVDISTMDPNHEDVAFVEEDGNGLGIFLDMDEE
ncbi:hypothetical protein TWF481_002857 [Arthrobotrys musiformis]|uniref:Uncharacterized protein n=1 Tax=Arthrobotrys musiformis TaxID=47236 RepID=A0AAV9VRG4_9PEZI